MTGVQTCALPILDGATSALPRGLKANTHAHFRRFAGTSARLTIRVLRAQLGEATVTLAVRFAFLADKAP